MVGPQAHRCRQPFSGRPAEGATSCYREPLGILKLEMFASIFNFGEVALFYNTGKQDKSDHTYDKLCLV
jgi:hypothetical protein